MRTSVKVLLGIGGVLLIGGIALMGVGGSRLGELEDPFILKEVTNGTIILHDEDGGKYECQYQSNRRWG